MQIRTHVLDVLVFGQQAPDVILRRHMQDSRRSEAALKETLKVDINEPLPGKRFTKRAGFLIDLATSHNLFAAKNRGWQTRIRNEPAELHPTDWALSSPPLRRHESGS